MSFKDQCSFIADLNELYGGSNNTILRLHAENLELREKLNSPSCDIDIIRRSAERGLALALKADPLFVDIFQHILDELGRVRH